MKFLAPEVIGEASAASTAAALTVNGALALQDGTNGAIIKDGLGSYAFRFVRALFWDDNQEAANYQVGNSVDKIVYSAANGTKADRLLFRAEKVQISDADSVAAPTDTLYELRTVANDRSILKIVQPPSPNNDVLQVFKGDGTTKVASLDKSAWFTHAGAKAARLTSNVSPTTTTYVDLTGLSVAIGASEVWRIELEAQVVGTATSGLNFQVTAPSGATGSVHGLGAVNAATAVKAVANATLIAASAFNLSATRGMVRLTWIVVNSTTAGTVQVQAASSVASQTTTVYTNSSITATRIA